MKPLRQKSLSRAERARGDSLDGAEIHLMPDGPFGGVRYLRVRLARDGVGARSMPARRAQVKSNKLPRDLVPIFCSACERAPSDDVGRDEATGAYPR